MVRTERNGERLLEDGTSRTSRYTSSRVCLCTLTSELPCARFHSLAGDPNSCLNRVSASVRALDQAILLEDEEWEEVMKEKATCSERGHRSVITIGAHSRLHQPHIRHDYPLRQRNAGRNAHINCE